MGFETFSPGTCKKMQGYHRVRQKNMLCQILHNLEHEEAVDALLLAFADHKIRKWTGRDTMEQTDL